MSEYPDEIKKLKPGRKIVFNDPFHQIRREQRHRYLARKKWDKEHPQRDDGPAIDMEEEEREAEDQKQFEEIQKEYDNETEANQVVDN